MTAGLSDKADREDVELLRQQFERHVAMITSQVCDVTKFVRV